MFVSLCEGSVHVNRELGFVTMLRLSRLRRWLTWRAIEIALYWFVAFAVVYLQFIALI